MTSPHHLPVTAFVIPCYNEEKILEDSSGKLLKKIEELCGQDLLSPRSFLLFVDDGSADATWQIINRIAAGGRNVRALKLAQNRGHQSALLAGLMYAKDNADAAISIDADLQDDISVLDQFMQAYLSGSDIVYGVRNDRSSDTFFKRFTAETFYRLLNFLGVKSVFNHADYRLMSRRALQCLAEYHEVNLYLRGMIPLMGFRHSIVMYSRKAVEGRISRYSLNKMLLLAWDGITSFSVKPIRLISLLGIVCILISLVLLIRFLYVKFFGYTVDGWTSLVLVIMMFGGVQLLSVGVIGEYVAKIYTEVKHRPRYTVEEEISPDKQEK